jgi:nucleoside-diphosphate-sugar epimerase
LVRQLIAAGHEVTGMTRSADKARWLEEQGAAAVVCDALDVDSMKDAVRAANPEVVIDELTDLPDRMNVFRFRSFYDRMKPLKEVAPNALLDVAAEVGAKRHLMQSVAFAYEAGPYSHRVHPEHDPPYLAAPKPWSEVLPAFARSEWRVSQHPGLEGIVLRYGFFYGPGTDICATGGVARDIQRRRLPLVGEGSGVYSFIHVEDAARATLLAAERGTRGVYNVVDDKPLAMSDWVSAYAEMLGARPPRRVPRWLARVATGAIPTHLATTLRGASNEKIRGELEWEPRYPDARHGLREDLKNAGRILGAPADGSSK